MTPAERALLGPSSPPTLLLRFGVVGVGVEAPDEEGSETDLPLSVLHTSTGTLLPKEQVTIVAAGVERIAVDAAAHARPPPPPPTAAQGDLPPIRADAMDDEYVTRLEASATALDQLGQRVQALATYVRTLADQVVVPPLAPLSPPSTTTTTTTTTSIRSDPIPKALAEVQPDVPHDLLRSLATVAASLPPPPSSPPPAPTTTESTAASADVPAPAAPAAPAPVGAPPTTAQVGSTPPDWLSSDALRNELQAEEADVLLASQLAQLTKGWGEMNEFLGKFEVARQTEAATVNQYPPTATTQADVQAEVPPASSS